MDSEQLIRIMDHFVCTGHALRGVYALDELEDMRKAFDKPPTHVPMFVIINTAVKTEPGVHWIAILKNVPQTFFLDSLGRKPHEYSQSLNDFLMSDYFTLPYPVQDSLNNTCGYWIVYLCSRLLCGWSLAQTLLPFSIDNKEFNDWWVVKWCKAIM